MMIAWPANLGRRPIGRQHQPRALSEKRALCRTRTDDPFLTMEVLYQLS